jgi:3-hydroxyacyl-CoA dehydrogenase
MTNFIVKKVAVLGAGVMGAQIAAHCINARVPVVLFDLPAKDGVKNGIALRAIENLKKLSPAPFGNKDDAALIQVANYDDDMALLGACDLIIEAIAERMDWKHDLYKKVAPHIAPNAIFASNTSGLSINTLADGFDDELKARFCGVHFFNPPRYMHLVELIPTSATAPVILDQLEAFLTTTLGKGVVRAKDTPNFIANRVGVFGMLAIMHEADKFGLSVDVVDDLTGTKLGRASSGTFRTADVVGLDTMGHVGQSERGPVLQPLPDPGRISQAGRGRRAGPEIGRRLLQEGRQGYFAPRLRQRRVCGRWRQGGRHRGPHTEGKRPGQKDEGAARIDQPAGAIPVGDLPRRFPLHRRPSGYGSRQCARHRFCDALGLRLERRPVRNLASGRLVADCRLDQ